MLLGMRMLFPLEQTMLVDGYPSIQIDICDRCYLQEVAGKESKWIPNFNKHGNPRYHGIDEAEFEEIKNNSKEVWEWWDNCSEVFEGSGYECNQCEEELNEGAWDIKNGKPIAFRR